MKNINLRIFSFLLMIIFYTTSISGRPQLPPEIVADDPNYPEGSWRPVSLMTREEKPATKPTIDENNSRVRIEHGGQTTEFRKARRDVSTNHPEAGNINSTKTKTHPIIGDSIKKLATQLLDPKDSETSKDVKNNKDSKMREEIVETSLKKERRDEEIEMSHAGIALPISLEDIEKELLAATTVTPSNNQKIEDGEGITTWVLLSGAPTTQKNIKAESLPQKPLGIKSDRVENLTNESQKQTNAPPKKIVKVTTPRPVVEKTNKPKLNAPNSRTATTTKQPAIENNEKTNSVNIPVQKNNNKPQLVLTRVKASELSNNQAKKNIEVSTTKAPAVIEENKKESQVSTEKVEPQEDLPLKQKFSMKQEISVKQEPSIKQEKPVENVSELTKENSAVSSVQEQSIDLESSAKHSELADSSIENEALETPLETTTEFYEPLESKSIEIDFPESRNEVITTTTKKPKRPQAIKRKKNKVRPKRPGTNKTEEIAEKTVNGTKTKPAAKIPPKPISTQIMNYLSREVMPTVGVGLVTLVAAAGVASYFLYPFGALRRSYEVDRQDTDLYNYNSEEYAGQDGQSEEEMFGKVIAGMPASNFYTKPYQPVYRYQPKKQQIRYRNVSPQSPIYSSNYNMYHQPSRNYNVQERFATYKTDSKLDNSLKSPISTSRDDTIETVVQKQTGYTVAGSELSHRSQFVVGNIPKELVVSEAPEVIITAATVPEHGPRRRRDVNVDNDADNEIDNDILPEKKPVVEIVTTTESLKTTTTNKNEDENKAQEYIIKESNDTSKIEPEIESTTSEAAQEDISTTRPVSLVDLVKRIINFKVRVGLSLLRSTSDAFSRYIDRVEERVKEAKIFD